MITFLHWIYKTLRQSQSILVYFLGPLLTWILFQGFLNDVWDQLFVRAEAMTAGVSGASVAMDLIALGNYVFPFDVVVALLVQYAFTKSVCACIRIVKSFVPTISG